MNTLRCRVWLVPFLPLLLGIPAWAADDKGGPEIEVAPGTVSQPTTKSPDKPETKPAGKTNAKPAASDHRAEDEYFELYKSLADTIDQVDRNYVKPLDRRELMEAAIKGILTKLDPYSSYISPDEITGFRTAVESQFGGIGIQIAVDADGQLKVASPLVGTPAYRAGVQSGDKITKIEGESVRNLSLDEAVRRLKGEVGTSVNFTVQHAFDGKTESFNIKRETIHVDTVMGDSRNPDDSWNYMLDPAKHIGYVRITQFSRDTAGDLKRALEQLQQQKMRALIIDLRFNPGGLLTSAVEVSDLFVSEGRIVSTKGRNIPERVWDAVKPGTFEGFPMVVLVNHYSASASEIVSACLQDHDRAVVVGDRTWGKGSVQNVIELEEGKSALKLTTATYTRPNGHNIHRFPDAKESDEWGVKPNNGLDVKLNDGEMASLLADRRQRDIVPSKSAHDETHEQPAVEQLTEKPRVKEEISVETIDPDASHKAADPSTSDTDSTEKSADSANEKTTSKEAASPAKTDGASKTDPAPTSTVAPKSPAASASASAAAKTAPKFVDRQLQKAIDYLTTELARAQ